MESKRYYVVEHMEEFLFDWSLCEYKQIMTYLKEQKNTVFIISNCDSFYTYEGEFSQKNQ